MNLKQPNANEATRTANRSRSVVPSSGLCSRCIDGCTGSSILGIDDHHPTIVLKIVDQSHIVPEGNAAPGQSKLFFGNDPDFVIQAIFHLFPN